MPSLGSSSPGPRLLSRVLSPVKLADQLPLEDAGREDDEDHPRTSGELVRALEDTWAMIDGCLRRWTVDDLETTFIRHYPTGERPSTRGWVVWHLLEHDLHHGGEISQILGSNGLPALDL